ncbi:MAG: hypothetical protein SCK70_05115, partial [bacterium]|nr:hypothetical protein [bacterium]
LIIMNPEHLRKKREALTFDPKTGLEKTMIQLTDAQTRQHILPQNISATWDTVDLLPAVSLQYRSNDILVKELFYCPYQHKPILRRVITIDNRAENKQSIILKTGECNQNIEHKCKIAAGETVEVYFDYELDQEGRSVKINKITLEKQPPDNVAYWPNRTQIFTGNVLLDRFFKAANYQLAGMLSRSGKVDASIWQYNREWVRDHAFMALGLILSGHHQIARTLLERLINEFVSDEGDCVDSSEKRAPEDVELDQNGTLLYVLEKYVLWTGELELVRQYWDKIEKIAEFPLKEVFRHEPSGMFHNSREYWERHQAHGIEDGIELLYQVFPALGLKSASLMARLLGKYESAIRWAQQSEKLKQAILNHPQFAMVDERGFIKRKDLNGAVQETIDPLPGSGLPPGVPLSSDFEHFLNPDTAAALPIAYGFVSPRSSVATATMKSLEQLWKQGWNFGGYGRYNMTSEADAHGPWPFASLFIARTAVETGEFEKVWRVINWLGKISGSRSGSWFEMYGPRVAPPYPQVGITPWTWAEMILLMVHHIVGFRPEAEGIRFMPRLLPRLSTLRCQIPIRGYMGNIEIEQDEGLSEVRFETDAEVILSDSVSILLAYPQKDFKLKAVVPALE